MWWTSTQSLATRCLPSSRILSPCKLALFVNNNNRQLFWEPHYRGDAKSNRDIYRLHRAKYEWQMKQGWKLFKQECKLWLKEQKEKCNLDTPIYGDGELVKIWNMRDAEVRKTFIPSYDALWEEGYSNASFEASPTGCGLFSGFLDTETLPADRTVEKAGWVALVSPEAKKSFYRRDYYDWTGFTHLRMRVRGDGRKYNITLRTPGSIDLTWFDMFSYALYTHGGPYWQDVRIPFSKFFFQYQGAIQDTQFPPFLSLVSTVSITLTERFTGPFALEIDYIGIDSDIIHEEGTAYESYAIKEGLHQTE